MCCGLFLHACHGMPVHAGMPLVVACPQELLALPLPEQFSRKPRKAAASVGLFKSISTGSLGNAALMHHTRQSLPSVPRSPGSASVIFARAAPSSNAAVLSCSSNVGTSSLQQQSPAADAEGEGGDGASRMRATAAVPRSQSAGSNSSSLGDSAGEDDAGWLGRLDNQWEEGSDASEGTAYEDAEEHNTWL